MKVYELMEKLSTMPAGAEVKIDMIKSLSELPMWESGLRHVEFQVMSVELDDVNKTVSLDGWTV